MGKMDLMDHQAFLDLKDHVDLLEQMEIQDLKDKE